MAKAGPAEIAVKSFEEAAQALGCEPDAVWGQLGAYITDDAGGIWRIVKVDRNERTVHFAPGRWGT